MIRYTSRRGPIAYTVRGAGPPVIAVHGAAGASDLWDDLLPHLQDLGLILPDLRGFGRTPTGPACGFDDLVDDLRAVVDEVGAGPPVALGFSFGAWLCLRWAERHPGELRGVIAVGSPLRADPALAQVFDATVARIEAEGRTAPELVEPFLPLWFSPGFRARRPEVVASARDQLLHAEPAAVARMVRWHLDGPDVREAAARLPIPSLAVVGEAEAIVDGAALRAAFGDRLVTIADCGHTVPAEQPDALAPVVRDFVRSAS